MNYSDLDTPALLIDKHKLIKNIQQMSKLAKDSGVQLRPHIKTHKMPFIANLQMEYGAIGITASKVSEALVFADSGFKNIRIANIICGQKKLESLLELHKKCDHLSVCVDSCENVLELAHFFYSNNSQIDVLIEINVGMDRSGLEKNIDILRLAKQIVDLQGIELIGILTHAGQSYNAKNLEEIKKIGKWEGERMVEIAEMLRSNSIHIDIVSVGSTPTVPYSAKVKGVTEIRPGNYVFFDIIQNSLRSCGINDCSLSILSKVISKPSENRYVVDAGKKSLSADGAVFRNDKTPSYGYIIETGGRLNRLSEEHGIVIHDSNTNINSNINIGDLVRIIPCHACTAANQFDQAYLCNEEKIEEVIEIAARGKFY